MSYQWKDGDQYVVQKIRQRWPKLCIPFMDKQLAELYDNFSMSEDYGNNDEKFPQWLEGGPESYKWS